MDNIELLPFNYRCFVEELENRGIACKLVHTTDIIEATYKGHTEMLLPSMNRLIPSHLGHIINDKYYLKKVLENKGFPVLQGAVFLKGMKDDALAYARALHFPVVIKATDSSNGDDVYVNIQDEQEFVTIWEEAVQHSPSLYFIVETYFEPSIDYRFFIMDGFEIAVAMRTPPAVVGDGKKTLRQIIEEENDSRMNPRNSCVGAIYLDDYEGKRVFQKKLLEWDRVIRQGEKVSLRYNSNICFGGLCENVTHKVHPSYFEVGRSLLKQFPGLSYLFADIFSKDISKEANEGMYVVNEMTTGLSSSMFTKPYRGEPVNILKPIVDLLFPETLIAQ